MAKKENKWISTQRVGEVTLFLTKRSSYWQMYWIDGTYTTRSGKVRPREWFRSTRETDLGLASMIAGRKNEELYKQRQFPDAAQKPEPEKARIRDIVADFASYLRQQGRSHGHVRTITGQMKILCDWLGRTECHAVQDVTPERLRAFTRHLLDERRVKPSTANAYLDAAHNFFGHVIFKRKVMAGPNPAARGRQAELDRLPEQRMRPPTIYPQQINDIIRVASEYNDTQIVNLIVFICEGGFRFQEVQFLQVGDMDLVRREIILDVKRPDLTRVRRSLQINCLTADGAWSPKTLAGRRPIHITDRMMTVIRSMGLGHSEDWVFVNSAGSQIAETKTLKKLKRYALEANVLVEPNPRTGQPWSRVKWHWLRHYNRTRAHVSGIRREVSKLAMGHAADPIHDHYRGVDVSAFHAEYEKFDSGIKSELLTARQLQFIGD